MTTTLTPIRSEKVSQKRFARIYARQKDSISFVEVLPPQLGRKGDFGGMRIVYTNPVLRKVRTANG